MGADLGRLRAALAPRGRFAELAPRLFERGDVLPIALPPWALDDTHGTCTTLVLLAPVPTQFGLHLQRWQDLPGSMFSSAGAIQVTRCGNERATLLRVLLEMRSPRAVVSTLIAVGSNPPPALVEVLPERNAGLSAPAGDPGPAPRREPLTERLRRFALLAREAGALAQDELRLPGEGFARVSLEPGCHRLLATSEQAVAFELVLRDGSDPEHEPERYDASDSGDVTREVCTARPRSLLVSVEGTGAQPDRRLALARFGLPRGLPGRFGPQAAEQLLEALGGSKAPKQLGPLVLATFGAQGKTPLARQLLPRTCYLGVVAAIHGEAIGLSLAARTNDSSSESTSLDDRPGPRIGFCTSKDGKVELDVEARGLGVAWLLALFQMGPAQVSP
jgi:hypothetical protein